jgi:glycerol-3-phosphate dehydrogenase
MDKAPAPYDVAVIGAGINGAGIARDAALRGLRVVVVDQGDLCSGTSAIPSRLIHGGLRYLEYGEFPLVFESLRERISLRRIAPHLIKPIRICIPIYESARRGPFIIRLGMLAYDLLSVGKTVPNHDMLSRAEVMEQDSGLAQSGLLGAARYYDAQVAFVERLVLENLLAARSAGADIHTHSEVTRINIEGGVVASVETRDTLNGSESMIAASVVVNAAGPWVDDVLAKTGRKARRLIGGTKGSHIVVGKFDGAPHDAYYVEAAKDSRPFFIIPWNDQFLIGTTDMRYDGDLNEIRASREEVEYLLAETNRVCGKLTTYRNLAEQAVNRIGRALRRRLPDCRTESTLLPGAYRLEEAREALEALAELSGEGVERLLDIYGGRAIDLLALAANEPPLHRTLDDRRTVLAAEVVFAVREEMARTLADIVYRRLMIGLQQDQGRPLYEMIAAIAASELGWTEDRRHTELEALNTYSDSLTVQ